jgi:hypothetical protein
MSRFIEKATISGSGIFLKSKNKDSVDLQAYHEQPYGKILNIYMKLLNSQKYTIH